VKNTRLEVILFAASLEVKCVVLVKYYIYKFDIKIYLTVVPWL
jgi:hypothetical protein